MKRQDVVLLAEVAQVFNNQSVIQKLCNFYRVVRCTALTDYVNIVVSVVLKTVLNCFYNKFIECEHGH